MPIIDIHLVDACWPDFDLATVLHGELTGLAALPGGMTSGRVSVTLRLTLNDGRVAWRKRVCGSCRWRWMRSWPATGPPVPSEAPDAPPPPLPLSSPPPLVAPWASLAAPAARHAGPPPGASRGRCGARTGGAVRDMGVVWGLYVLVP